MPSNFADRKPAKPQNTTASNPPPPQPSDPLPCPRCDSINTKFCYYNNYNTSQPRHFCKACRRYWTQGGSLRDVPVGGGTRKTSKRSRSSASSPSPPSSSVTHEPVPSPTNPVSVFPVVKLEKASPVRNIDVNLNADVSGTESFTSGGFTALMNMQGPGNFDLGGYGFGLGSIGPGLHEMGFGLGRGVWGFAGVGDIGGSVVPSGCNTWQMNGVESSFVVDGECFAWPEIAVSTAGKMLK